MGRGSSTMPSPANLILSEQIHAIIEANPQIVLTFLIGGMLFILALVLYKCLDKPSKCEDVSKGLRREQALNASFGELTGLEKALNPAIFRSFQLTKCTDISSNTKLLRFNIPFNLPLGLPVGRHVSVRATIDGNVVIRPYTPTSRPDQNGYFELLVKNYEFGKVAIFVILILLPSSIFLFCFFPLLYCIELFLLQKMVYNSRLHIFHFVVTVISRIR